METVVPIIEYGFIYNILFQEHYEEDVDNFKNLLGIKEDYGYMVVLVFGDEQEGSHMTNAVGTSVKVQSRYREVRELIKSYFTGIVGNVMGNKIPIFIPHESGSLEYSDRIELIEKARVMTRTMRKHMDTAFRAGFGSVHVIRESMESYNEALNSLVNTTGTVAHVDDLPHGCDYEDNYPVETEQTLMERTEKGDLNGAVAAANHFFDWMVENYPDCVMDIKLKALEFVLSAEHLAYENGGMTYHFKARQDYLPALLEFRELDQVRRWYVDKISQACRNIMTQKEERSSSVIDKAKAYILQHYKKDISLDEVSREVDISPYYFSKIFKEETGENFIEYLTNIRIKTAKELLLSSDLSMKEICSEVGYSDPNYFSRTFKKNVGVTPTEYKEGK